MNIERTFSIIKPNKVKKNVIGSIFSCFEIVGFRIIGMKMLRLTVEQASGFYAEYEDQIFFKKLIDFMVSGPIVISVLEGENVIERYRKLLETIDPKNIEEKTWFSNYDNSFIKNSIHASESVESAKREISYFFGEGEIYLQTNILTNT